MDENSRSRDSLQILVNFSEMSYLLTYNTRHVKTFFMQSNDYSLLSRSKGLNKKVRITLSGNLVES